MFVFSGSFFFLSGFSKKQGEVKGVYLSVQILGAPNNPILSISSQCQDSGPIVYLSWPEDSETQSFEILRNGETLISGITGTSYQDASVLSSTSYSYQVIVMDYFIMPTLKLKK